MSNFNIALKVRAKHGLIYNYMTEYGLSYTEMAEKIGITSSTLAALLHFRWKPNRNNYQSVATIKKLEKFFHCTIEDIFPTELVKQIGKNKELQALLQQTHVINKEIDLEYLSFDKIPEITYMPDFDGFDLKDNIAKVLSILTPREEIVIRSRFGIGEQEQTLEEVGAKIGTGKENVRRIEAKAMRKLKHPSRLKVLKEFLNYTPIWERGEE